MEPVAGGTPEPKLFDERETSSIELEQEAGRRDHSRNRGPE